MEHEPGKLAGSAYGILCRVALRDGRDHPEITFRTDALLCSINDRLGALLEAHAGRPARRWRATGATLEPLSTEWLDEMIHFAGAEAEDIDETREDGRE